VNLLYELGRVTGRRYEGEYCEIEAEVSLALKERLASTRYSSHFSSHPSVAAHDMPCLLRCARSPSQLLLKYASGRRPSRASYPRASPAPHDDGV